MGMIFIRTISKEHNPAKISKWSYVSFLCTLSDDALYLYQVS